MIQKKYVKFFVQFFFLNMKMSKYSSLLNITEKKQRKATKNSFERYQNHSEEEKNRIRTQTIYKSP